MSLAREAIDAKVQNRKTIYGVIPSDVRDPSGVFVTLTQQGRLRGCMGTLEAFGPLYKEVVENALRAAFGDPRFEPLNKDECMYTNIEISVLSPLTMFTYDSAQSLISKLELEKPGVVLTKGVNRATYLPSVWAEFCDAKEFLSSLCVKAGLSPDSWRDEKNQCGISTYSAAIFSEER